MTAPDPQAHLPADVAAAAARLHLDLVQARAATLDAAGRAHADDLSTVLGWVTGRQDDATATDRLRPVGGTAQPGAGLEERTLRILAAAAPATPPPPPPPGCTSVGAYVEWLQAGGDGGDR
jgi:hypothetical protein